MSKVAIMARLEAKAGNESEVADFLAQALKLAETETSTPIWFALRLGPSSFGIFDAFNGDEDREKHLNGPIAKELFRQADRLLAKPPMIEKVDVLGAKGY